MRKMLLIALHDYRRRILSKSLLVMFIVLPVMLLGLGGFLYWGFNYLSTLDTIGYVDQADFFPDSLVSVQQAAKLDAYSLQQYPDLQAGLAAVNAEQVDVLIMLEPNYLQSGVAKIYVNRFIPLKATFVVDELFKAAAQEYAAKEPNQRVLVPIRGMTTTILDSTTNLRQDVSRVLAAIVFLGTFVNIIMFTTGHLINSVIEERQNRIIEILVSTVSPAQLMTGKIVGLGLYALTLMVLIQAVFVGGLRVLFGPVIGSMLPVIGYICQLMVLVFVPFYILIAALTAALGTVFASPQQSKQLTGLISLSMLSPLLFINTLSANPTGLIGLALSLFPVTSSIVIVLRIGLDTVPFWQVVLTSAWTWLWAVLAIRLCGASLRRFILDFRGLHFFRRKRLKQKPPA